jgi:DNA-binding MarR family transcriptional regulator
MTKHDQSPGSLISRLGDGLSRLSAVLRSDQWGVAQVHGVNPAQLAALALLARRPQEGCALKEIAAHLGVSQPTATDTVLALQQKHLVSKSASQEDRRSVRIVITQQGKTLLRRAAQGEGHTAEALAALSPSEQADLLLLLVKLIRQLQLMGAIPAQRMCSSCRHFRPHVHAGSDHPHHCDFVNAAFGDRDIRLDCGDHQPADPAIQAATWKAFEQGSAHLRATSHREKEN